MATYSIEQKKDKARFVATRDSTNRKVALTGWAPVKELNMKKLNEALRMANLGRRVPLAHVYMMFPPLSIK